MAAVPAMRGQFKTITLKDGTQVRLELRGDEFMHYWQAEDGRCFVEKGENYEIADMAGMINSANQMRQARQRKSRTRGIGDSKTYIGKKKGLIILVQYEDKKFKPEHNADFFRRVANEPGFSEGDYKGSVRDYFYDQSNGVFEIEFDIAGPYTLANKYEFYGANNPDRNNNDKNPGKMISEAVTFASTEFDFTQYDWDGDREVDQVFVVYAGQGEANGGDANTIWPHEWTLEYATGSKMNINNVVVNTYACGPELGGSESVTSGIGTLCHEYTHCLGIPDFYDTAYGGYYGMGNWDVMCNGSYSGNGFSPAGYTSYEKAWCGWLNPVVLKNDTIVDNMRPLSENGGAYVIYNDNHPDEYYLLECRNRTGWDSEVKGSGLLVIHVDYDPYLWRYNLVNSKGEPNEAGEYDLNDHPRLTLIPADNSLSLKNEAYDTYPYNNRNFLNNVSIPAAKLYNANTDGSKLMNKSIAEIKRNEDGSVGFKFKGNDTTSERVFEGVLFEETFDLCNGTGGNDGNWTNSTNDFVPDNIGWTYSGESSANGGDKCARFGSRVNKGTVTLPKVVCGEKSILTFKAAPWNGEDTKIGVSVLGGEKTTLSPSSFALQKDQWTECTATIEGAGDLTITLTPTNNRFFLDDVKITAVSGSSGISSVSMQTKVDNRIYDLNGRFVGTDINSLRKGIYISGGKKIVK